MFSLLPPDEVFGCEFDLIIICWQVTTLKTVCDILQACTECIRPGI